MIVGGIDVSMETLDVGIFSQDRHGRHRQFPNDEFGFAKLREFAEGFGVDCFALEATGPYHKAVVRFLREGGARVVCLNPRRARQLALGLGILAKDDKLDAFVLARAVAMGARSEPSERTRVHEAALELSRRIEQLGQDRAKERTRLKEPRLSQFVEESLRRHIQWLGAQIEELERQWLDLIQEDADLLESYRFVISVPNVGPKTARVVVSELPPKEQILARRKAVGLAGLAPKRKRSGTSLNAPDRIPKACNSHLKKALYMPAVQALRRSPDLRDFYVRLVGTGKHPKQALTAVMRKIWTRILAVLERRSEWKQYLTT